jgi:hypothetical protein
MEFYSLSGDVVLVTKGGKGSDAYVGVYRDRNIADRDPVN